MKQRFKRKARLGWVASLACLLLCCSCAKRPEPTADELVASFSRQEAPSGELVIPDYYLLRPEKQTETEQVEQSDASAQSSAPPAQTGQSASVPMSDLTLEEYEQIENSPVDWEQVVKGNDPAPKPWWLTSDSFEAPKLVKIPRLHAPHHLMHRQDRPTVVLRISLDRAGAVKSVAILKSFGDGLDEACVDRVRRAEFTPATWNGVPMPFTVLLPCRVHPSTKRR